MGRRYGAYRGAPWKSIARPCQAGSTSAWRSRNTMNSWWMSGCRPRRKISVRSVGGTCSRFNLEEPPPAGTGVPPRCSLSPGLCREAPASGRPEIGRQRPRTTLRALARSARRRDLGFANASTCPNLETCMLLHPKNLVRVGRHGCAPRFVRAILAQGPRDASRCVPVVILVRGPCKGHDVTLSVAPLHRFDVFLCFWGCVLRARTRVYRSFLNLLLLSANVGEHRSVSQNHPQVLEPLFENPQKPCACAPQRAQLLSKRASPAKNSQACAVWRKASRPTSRSTPPGHGFG